MIGILGRRSHEHRNQSAMATAFGAGRFWGDTGDDGALASKLASVRKEYSSRPLGCFIRRDYRAMEPGILGIYLAAPSGQ